MGPFRLPALLAWALTMFCSCVAWLCFYEVDTTRMFAKLGTLLTPAEYAFSGLSATIRAFPAGDRMVLGCLFVLAILTLLAEWQSIRRLNDPYAYLRKKPVLIGLVIVTVLLAPGKNNGFIYFAF
jgi:hypothetical protein